MGKLLRLLLPMSVGLLLFFAFIHPAPARSATSASDLFVAADGSGSACTASAPCDLTTALSLAHPGDVLYLAGGTYTAPALGAVATITTRVELHGGWDGQPTTPPVVDAEAHPVILDGEGAHRGLFIANAGTVLIEGVNVVNGYLDTTLNTGAGAGIYAYDTQLLLHNVVISGNAVNLRNVPASVAYGGGVAIHGGTLAISESSFLRNSVYGNSNSYGGGLYITGTITATLKQTTFDGNDAWHGSALAFDGGSSTLPLYVGQSTFVNNGTNDSPGTTYGGYGAAFDLTDGNVTVEGCRIEWNSAYNEGAVAYAYRGRLTMRGNFIRNNKSHGNIFNLTLVNPLRIINNIIAENVSLEEGHATLMLLSVSNGMLVHNTLVHNPGDYGILLNHTTADVINTIIVSHTTGISVTTGSSLDMDGMLWGSGEWANGEDWQADGSVTVGTVSLHADPRFLKAEEGNYHLTAGSPAIDAGVEVNVLDDFDGDRRPLGRTSDIGADEFRGLYLPLVLRQG